jgi:hypothetical protein
MDNIETLLQEHATVKCTRQLARISEEACKRYREYNRKLACVGCERCPPGEYGGAADWLKNEWRKFGL